MSNPKPMDANERAAMEKRLEELKALKAQKDAQAAQQPQHDDPNGEYDDDYNNDGDEEDEDYDSEAENFFNNASPQGNQPPQGEYKLDQVGDDSSMQIVQTDKSKIIKRAIGDFEQLRLAKMGDWQSLQDFAAMSNESLVLFEDNKHRNTLHYAADSGNAKLLEALTDLKIPYKTDDNGLTPLDIAVLNQSSPEVIVAIQAIAQLQKHADATASKNYEETLHKFAVEPPKFVLSKATPAAATAGAVRQFWKESREETTMNGVTLSTTKVESSEAAELLQKELGEMGEKSAGLRHSLVPAFPTRVTSQSTNVTVVKAKAGEATVGTISSMRLEGGLKGFGKKLGSVSLQPVAVVNYLAVEPSKRGPRGLTPVLLAEIGKQQSAETQAVCFTTNEQLPSPPTAVCAIKWFHRVLNPQEVFKSDIAHDLFPEFFEYDTILRADNIAKHAFNPELLQKHEADLVPWAELDHTSAEQLQTLLTFLQTELKESVADLAYVPASVADLSATIAAEGNRVFVYVVDGALKDLVVFTERKSQRDPLGAPKMVQVVFSLFTSKTGTEKVEHLFLLAKCLLDASVVFAPSTSGLTDSDLAKCNFEEVKSGREFLYVQPVHASNIAVSPVAATPASRVYSPAYLF